MGLVQIEGLVLVDASGSSRASSIMYPAPSPPPSVAALPVFKYIREKRDNRVMVRTALKSDVDGEWVLPIARRLENRDGSFAGAIGARGKVGYFQQFYSDLNLEEGTRGDLIHIKRTRIA